MNCTQLVGVLIASAMIAGCGAGSPSSEAFLTDDSLSSRVEALKVGLESVGWDGDPLEDAAARTHENLVRACLTRAGYATDPLPTTADAAGAVLSGPSSLEIWLARGGGWGIGAQVSDPQVLRALRAPGASQDSGGGESYPQGSDAALYGDPQKWVTFPLPGGRGGDFSRPVGGCFGKATSELYGVTAEEYERAYMSLPRTVDVLVAVTASADVRADVSEWSSCMAGKGLDIDDPSKISSALSARVALVVSGEKRPSDVTSYEADIARSDIACKASSGLGTSFARAFVEKGEALLKGKEGVVLRYHEMILHAHSVIAKGSGEGRSSILDPRSSPTSRRRSTSAPPR